MSNAFVMSNAIAIVLSGGFFMLNPVVIVLLIICSGVMAESFAFESVLCVISPVVCNMR